MESATPFKVLLYYKFVRIENSEEFAKAHLAFCKDLGLKGRILVAEEGINGTVSGTVDKTNQYMEIMRQDPRFSDMVFKIEEVNGHAFKKMFVRHRRSIISLFEEDEANPNEVTGNYLKPKEFYEALQREDVIVLDGRNDYEYEIGHFRQAIKPNVQSFREFPQWIDENLSEHKDKMIISYCTGGIRCEKLTGVLINKGFTNVHQLDGGIITYGQDSEVQGRLFDGKCYVFDERIAVGINRTDEDVIISHCHHCGQPSDRYINCVNDDCHKKHFCCVACEVVHESLCSEACREYVLNHPNRRHTAS
jgi:UPF0176 protein